MYIICTICEWLYVTQNTTSCMHQVMAQICQDGYTDALRFLQEANFLHFKRPSDGVFVEVDCPTDSGCEFMNESTESIDEEQTVVVDKLILPLEHHWWLDAESIKTLPIHIKQGHQIPQTHRMYINQHFYMFFNKYSNLTSIIF
ncbi:hypothetical protein DPEC_G00222270 [Dallia pectoralis]|uniref:Uncharacterized protein n=1 Tax=Dallia pectoralis TaxID=75939 RepID=A0ACC2G438_DALPE|nr:hypothetical protein DPEC_G00222270 [Dallia pectoralis]